MPKQRKVLILKHVTLIAFYEQSKLSYVHRKRNYVFLVSIVFITDVPRFRALSPIFIYSVCLYVVFNIMSFLSARDIFLHVLKKDDSISGTIFNILLIFGLANCTGVPVLSWIDTPKFLQYLHKWKQFKVGSNSQFMEFSVN
jgi:hypothetical protein